MPATSDEVVIEFLNSIVRKHRFKFKRPRALLPAKRKAPVTGGVGVSYGATKITV